MELEDPYRELGLTAEATDAQVKAAWRRLAARWHPDRNASPQALQRIQRINRALEEIRRVREQGGDGCASQPQANQPAQEPAPGAAGAEHEVSLSLEEAAGGCVRTVEGQLEHPCDCCAGSGCAPEPAPCARCGGCGQLRQPLWFPWLGAALACDACTGSGTQAAPCAACAGSGQAAPLHYRSRVRIPAGVRDGHVLHASVPLQGRAGHQLLQVRVSVHPHEFFVLDPDGTVRLEVPVDGLAWCAQRWIEVPTPHGLRQMRLQRGALAYRIRGEGFPAAPGGEPADCLVNVVPLFPIDWSPAQQVLLDALIAANTGDSDTEAGARAQAWVRTLAAWPGAAGAGRRSARA